MKVRLDQLRWSLLFKNFRLIKCFGLVSLKYNADGLAVMVLTFFIIFSKKTCSKNNWLFKNIHVFFVTSKTASLIWFCQKPELLVFPPLDKKTVLRKEIDSEQHEVVLKLTEVLVDEERKRRNSIHIEVGGNEVRLADPVKIMWSTSSCLTVARMKAQSQRKWFKPHSSLSSLRESLSWPNLIWLYLTQSNLILPNLLLPNLIWSCLT